VVKTKKGLDGKQQSPYDSNEEAEPFFGLYYFVEENETTKDGEDGTGRLDQRAFDGRGEVEAKKKRVESERSAKQSQENNLPGFGLVIFMAI